MSKHDYEYPSDTLALVVGGSGGIGRAVSYALADAGIAVHVHGLHNDRVHAALETIRSRGGTAEGTTQQIETADDILPLMRRLHEQGVPPTILVVAFGPIEYASLATSSLDLHRRMMELNYVLPAALIRESLPAMERRGFGRIVLFGGSATDRIQGFTTIPAYSAAKTALGSLVKSTAKAVAKKNRETGNSAQLDVTINAICPDYVHTEYLTGAEVERYAHAMPLKRLVTPQEIADLAVFLTRPAAASISGELLRVDQGKQR